MSYEEWLGDTHSPTHPKLSLRDLSMIHKDGYAYNPKALSSKEEAFEYALKSELDFIASRFGRVPITEQTFREIVKNAKKVRGDIVLKVSVALYALKLYDADVILKYAKLKGKEGLTRYDLFSYAYKYRLSVVREKVTFKDVLAESVEAQLIPRQQLAKAEELFNEVYSQLLRDPENMGKKPSTLARQALKRALEMMGYGA